MNKKDLHNPLFLPLRIIHKCVWSVFQTNKIIAYNQSVYFKSYPIINTIIKVLKNYKIIIYAD